MRDFPACQPWSLREEMQNSLLSMLRSIDVTVSSLLVTAIWQVFAVLVRHFANPFGWLVTGGAHPLMIGVAFLESTNRARFSDELQWNILPEQLKPTRTFQGATLIRLQFQGDGSLEKPFSRLQNRTIMIPHDDCCAPLIILPALAKPFIKKQIFTQPPATSVDCSAPISLSPPFSQVSDA
jgi:hypothetical protein